MPAQPHPYVFGIDLGTTFTSCARIRVGAFEPEAIPVDGHRKALPSVIWLQEPGGRLHATVGHRAVEDATKATASQGCLIEFAKRHIGRTGDDGRTWELGRHSFDPVDASALILRKVKASAAEFDPTAPLLRAVVTHPRDFRLPQRNATAEAVAAAGIELIETMNEPEAAAYMYFQPGEVHEPGMYLVFDLGGGTLDIAVIEVPRQGRIRVIDGHGVPRLGGKDWDDAMLKLFDAAGTAHHSHAFPYLSSVTPSTVATLRRKAVELKETAPRWKSKNLLIDTELFEAFGGQRFYDTSIAVDRDTWDAACRSLVGACEDAIDAALKAVPGGEAKLVKVLPVGGSVRLPTVQDLLHRRFGDRLEPIDDRHGLDVELAVSQGAARYASYLMAQRAEATAAAPGAAPTQSRIQRLADSAPATTLSHPLSVLTWSAHGEPLLDALLARNADVPARCQRRYRIMSAGETTTVDIYELDGGALPSGVHPSGSVAFSAGTTVQEGDVIAVVLDVSESGRIQVHAIHERTGRRVEATLRDPTATSAPPADRHTRLDAIEVV